MAIQKTVTERTKASPDISIVSIQLENILKVLDSFVEMFLCSKNTTDGVHGGDGSRISNKSSLISVHCLIEIAQNLCETP